MKYKNAFYLQLSRLILETEPYKSMSINAKWLYVVLKGLEHRYTGAKEDFFFRSNEDLAADAGLSVRALYRAKAELLKTDLVDSWQMHFVNSSGKKSEKHVSAYRMLK